MRKILLLFMMLLFAISASSKDFKYHPKTKDELKELIENEAIYLGDIDTSAITDMSYLFIRERKKLIAVEQFMIIKLQKEKTFQE